MLLNLSNHPSHKWPAKQLELAYDLYGSVQDLPFPRINPEATGKEIEQMAEEYLKKINVLSPDAVHIMGELTFSFNLVRKLQKEGIMCIASTTERKTTDENGVKTSVFEFVKFREYTNHQC